MDNVATIGLDIAKSVFQVHGVERLDWCQADTRASLRKVPTALKRKPCRVRLLYPPLSNIS